MRLITALLLFSFNTFGQLSYNPLDTTYTFSYTYLQKIKNGIESCKAQRFNLEREITLLEDLTNTQDLKIKKLEVRDSLYAKELELYREMDSVLREKSSRANEIMNNYKILLIGTEEQLKIETKKAIKERRWKQVYKYSYPVAAIITGIIIFK